MSAPMLEFILLVQEMRISQKQSLKNPDDKMLTVRRLQLEINVDESLQAMVNEQEPGKRKEVQ